MGDTITMSEKQLGVRLRADAKGAPKAVLNAMVSAAQRGKAFLVKASPVDRGILRNAWKVVKLSSQMTVELVNDQPYAGVMERGARPFKISREGIEALARWVFRKLLSGGAAVKKAGGKFAKHLTGARQHQLRVRSELEEEALSIAWAIAKTFEKVGIKGKRFVMSNLTLLASLMDAEVTRYLSKFFNRGMGSKE